MPTRILAAFVAVALMAAYLGPILFKMKDAALAIVILIGMVVMLVDLLHTLRDSND